MCMDNTLQRKRLHTTISEKAYDKLEEIRKQAGFTSSSQALEFIILNESIKVHLNRIYEAIAKIDVHKQHTPDTDISNIPGIFRGSDLKIIKDEEV